VGTVVEFCGLPGAGKSTIARALVGSLRVRGVPTIEVMAPLGPAASRGERVRRKAGVVGRGLVAPGGPTIVGNVAFRSAQADGRDRLARPVNLLVVRDAVRRARRRPGIHVLDQGPVQEWWSAALRGDEDRVLAWAAADPNPRADLLVRVDAPVAVLRDRLGRRDRRQSRLEAVAASDLDAELVRGATLMDAVCERLGARGDAPGPAILRVDGRDRAAADVVAEALLRRP
jgi:predicted kinase